MTTHILLNHILATFIAIQVGCQPDQNSNQQMMERRMADNSPQGSQSSKDAKELLKMALALARSDRPEDHEALLKHLRSSDFLGRLDSESDYAAAASKRLRILRVLQALGENKAPTAHKAIVALTQDQVFLEEDERVVGLIEASAKINPPPPELIRFWDDHSQPEDGFEPVTITTLVDNGSEAAMGLLEKKMAAPEHEDDVKIAWMRSEILTHRNDLLLLQSCERMLKSGLSQILRPHLIEVLFDYRPGEWFRPASVSRPPDRRQASPEALKQLRKIGELALKTVTLSEEQKRAVEKTLDEIDRLK